jgi:hypothetical protein
MLINKGVHADADAVICIRNHIRKMRISFLDICIRIVFLLITLTWLLWILNTVIIQYMHSRLCAFFWVFIRVYFKRF